jgi:hypothetical protein
VSDVNAKASANVHRLVWTSMLFAPVIYTVLGLGVIKPTGPVMTEVPLLTILAGAAVVMAVLSVILRGRLADRVTAMDPADPRRPYAAMQASIIPWALNDTIAVFGFFLMILDRPPIQWVPFCIVSFAMMLLHAPRSET